MRATVVSILAAAIGWASVTGTSGFVPLHARGGVRQITWADTAPLHARLEALGLSSSSFQSTVERIADANARRVREGDVDHLVFYLLQATRFTRLRPIEPALSAKALVESLPEPDRDAFLRGPGSVPAKIPGDVRMRVSALVAALDSSIQDPRLEYFRALVKATFPDRRTREAGLAREYLRVMRFVYQKEFVAQRSAAAPAAVAELYRTRGLSTDTAVEAGYVVYLGLAVARSLQPDHAIRRVLIIGPGLDLAPRTGLLEAGPPQSYQPWAVIDALLTLGLSRPADLEVVAADINPRVVDHLRRARAQPPSLTLVSGIQDSDTVTIADDYRRYFDGLGRAIGQVDRVRGDATLAGHLRKVVRVRPEAARALRAESLDIVTERLDGPGFDLVVATNILPYFDDAELMLAMANVASMIVPGGVFLHNEARPVLGELTSALGLPFQQSRHVIIASVRGAPAPLFDSVWLHRKTDARD